MQLSFFCHVTLVFGDMICLCINSNTSWIVRVVCFRCVTFLVVCRLDTNPTDCWCSWLLFSPPPSMIISLIRPYIRQSIGRLYHYCYDCIHRLLFYLFYFLYLLIELCHMTWTYNAIQNTNTVKISADCQAYNKLVNIIRRRVGVAIFIGISDGRYYVPMQRPKPIRIQDWDFWLNIAWISFNHYS